MKLFALLTLIFSLNSFAGSIGYNCLALDAKEEVKLEKHAAKLKPHYLSFVKILIVKPELCGIPNVNNQEVCNINGFPLIIENNGSAQLMITKKTIINIFCEEDRINEPQPAGGGSN